MRSDPDASRATAGPVWFSIFRSSLAGKFSLMFLALLVPLAVVGFTISRGLTANAEALLRAHRVKQLAARSFALVLTQDDVTKEILLDPARISEAERKIAAYDENRDALRELASLTPDSRMLEIVEGLERLDEETLRPLDSEILEASFGGSGEMARQIYFERYEPVRLEYLQLGRELGERADEVARQAEVELALKNRHSVTNVAVSLLAGIALVAVVMRLITRDIQRRLAALMGALESVARRDLTQAAIRESADEIGRIGSALAGAIFEMRSALLRVSQTSNDVETQVMAISRASGVVATVASQQGQEVARASEAMEKATEQVWGIAESARVLRSMVDESQATIDSIAEMSEGFRRRADLLNQRIEDTATSASDMGASMDQVSASIEVLAMAAHETSSSANEMAASMSSVDEVARTCEELWREMVNRGQLGLQKVNETLVGIEEVRLTTSSAEGVVKGLAERATEIGKILDVINDVADETNLLALNAAIIAAQAGDGGRAFSVVAEEIKGLAERVTLHTREIETLIGAVQDESENAIAAIARGSSSVSSVVALSGEAGQVVEDMTHSSQENAIQLGEIARAVREQNQAAERVVGLMSRTDAAVDEIREAVKRQASGSRAVLDSTEVMHREAREMSTSAIEQADSLRRVAESVARIREAAEAAETALDEQTRSTLSVAEFLERVDSRSSENTRSAELTSQATTELQQLVESLRREVLRFRL